MLLIFYIIKYKLQNKNIFKFQVAYQLIKFKNLEIKRL